MTLQKSNIENLVKSLAQRSELNQIRRKAVSLGNKLAKTLNRSEAFKKAWKFVKMRKAATNRPTCVEFVKKNGQTRRALITTDMGRLPETKTPKGTGRPSTSSYLKCWDIFNQKWISFHAYQIAV